MIDRNFEPAFKLALAATDAARELPDQRAEGPRGALNAPRLPLSST